MPSTLSADFKRLADYRERHSLLFFLETALFDNGFQAVMMHRIAHRLKRWRIPGMAPLVARLNIAMTGVDISPRAEIGPGLVISHGVGLVIGGSVTIGKNALLHHGVTVGAPTPGRIVQMPTIGDDVVLGTGATVIGPVTIGDGAFIGAGVLLTRDVPECAKVTVAGEPHIEVATDESS